MKSVDTSEKIDGATVLNREYEKDKRLHLLFDIYDHYHDTSVEITHFFYIFIGSLGAIATFLLLFLKNLYFRNFGKYVYIIGAFLNK